MQIGVILILHLSEVKILDFQPNIRQFPFASESKNSKITDGQFTDAKSQAGFGFIQHHGVAGGNRKISQGKRSRRETHTQTTQFVATGENFIHLFAKLLLGDIGQNTVSHKGKQNDNSNNNPNNN